MDLLLQLNPFVCHKIWGGNKLTKIKNIEAQGLVGETWEISSHPAGPSKIALNQTGLNELVDLSYIVKYIDTSANLSVQVHPDDAFAGEHEDEKGKTECWLVLDAEPGAGIFLGFKPGVTKKEFKTALEAGMPVDRFLNFHEVKRGDFFLVPAGAVHAIGAGVTLVETQQSSGVTYRVWDWNRLGDDGKPRQLHVEKALEVLRFDDAFNKQLDRLSKRGLLDNAGATPLCKHADFKAEILTLEKDAKKEIRVRPREGFTLLEGKLEIDGRTYKAFDSAISTQEGMIGLRALERCSLLSVMDKE